MGAARRGRGREDPLARGERGSSRRRTAQDTIAFGTPPSSSGRDGQGSYVQPGYGSQPRRAGLVREPGRLRPRGLPGPGDSGDPAGHQAGGGYGAPGWARPDPPPGRPGRGGRFLVYLTVAALAAGIGAGVTVALNHHGAAPSAGISSNDVPGPHNNAAGSGSSSAPLNGRRWRKRWTRPGRHHLDAQVRQRDGRGHRDDHFVVGTRADQQPRDRRGHGRAGHAGRHGS